MKISRLEVSGGFLDGLRLDFSDGLNVLIGARGAGKTSVLELVRFALGIEAMTRDADDEAVEQARAVLADGTVSLHCTVQGEDLVFTRTGLDDAPSRSASYVYQEPLIVSQSEIEAIGLDPVSRRTILDHLIDPLDWEAVGLENGRSLVASLERRLERLRQERAQLVDQISGTPNLDEQLKAAEAEQSAAAQEVAAAQPLQQVIAKLSDDLGQIRSGAEAYKIADQALTRWRENLGESRIDRPIPTLPSRDVAQAVDSAVASARKHIQDAARDIDEVQKLVEKARTEIVAQQGQLQTSLRVETEKLEAIQAGAGEIGRRVSTLRQQLKERQGLAERVGELDKEISTVLHDRETALDDLDAQADARYSLRRERAGQLTRELNGRIEVRVDKSGEYGAYESSLVALLQGSNLQYKSLAAELAPKMSPREIVTAVETGDYDSIVRAVGISADRAVRLVAHLEQQSRAELLLVPLEDAVDFALLDGQDYKTTSRLSMGQRCTVVLPLLLAEDRDAILLDQPEDHLDNAFIVETLVEAARERAKTGQVIVATHNANIPVLGEARLVVVMGSDGRRGFVQIAAPLDAEDAVDAITTLMEGGREAFARRAAFYNEHEHVG